MQGGQVLYTRLFLLQHLDVKGAVSCFVDEVVAGDVVVAL